MPLVEHIAQRRHATLVVVERQQRRMARRLHHRQRMIGDDDPARSRLAHDALQETAPVVRTRRVDALALPVGQRAREPRLRPSPRRKIATLQIAALRRRQPARDEAQRHGLAFHQHRQPPRRLFEIEQTDIILAPLAHRHLLGTLGLVGINAREFLPDLALKVFRIGRNPNRAFVALCPKRCRRQIPGGLTQPCARFGKHDNRLALVHTRAKGLRRQRRVIGLRAPRLRSTAHDDGEIGARLLRRNRHAARLTRGRRVFPLGQIAPHVEPGMRPQSSLGIEPRQQ